jgi:hypothetical protein
MLAVTNPVAADQPGTNEDPFGGHPITGALGPEAGEGIVAKFGLSPFGYAWPGGVPSNKSGDGTTPRRAINIGGIWGGRGDIPLELSNCATLKIPAGAGRWFKLDTWSDRRVRIWLDDELDGATKPSGSSVWGAADQYMLGTAPGDGWQRNALNGSQSANFLEGFVMAIYDPDNLKPMWSFRPPNAAILSVNTDSAGLLLSGPDNISVKDATGAGVHGYGSHNPGMPNHLLWYEGRFDGWVYVLIYNQMIWDGTASVCSQRVY